MCADVAVQAFYFSKNRHAGLFPRTSVKQGYRVKKSTENKKIEKKARWAKNGKLRSVINTVLDPAV